MLCSGKVICPGFLLSRESEDDFPAAKRRDLVNMGIKTGIGQTDSPSWVPALGRGRHKGRQNSDKCPRLQKAPLVVVSLEPTVSCKNLKIQVAKSC